MPNIAQQELLDSFIAGEGIYFETIRDDEAFNLGTKILYLEGPKVRKLRFPP